MWLACCHSATSAFGTRPPQRLDLPGSTGVLRKNPQSRLPVPRRTPALRIAACRQPALNGTTADLSDRAFLQTYADVMRELRRREVITSWNIPWGTWPSGSPRNGVTATFHTEIAAAGLRRRGRPLRRRRRLQRRRRHDRGRRRRGRQWGRRRLRWVDRRGHRSGRRRLGRCTRDRRRLRRHRSGGRPGCHRVRERRGR